MNENGRAYGCAEHVSVCSNSNGQSRHRTRGVEIWGYPAAAAAVRMQDLKPQKRIQYRHVLAISRRSKRRWCGWFYVLPASEIFSGPLLIASDLSNTRTPCGRRCRCSWHPSSWAGARHPCCTVPRRHAPRHHAPSVMLTGHDHLHADRRRCRWHSSMRECPPCTMCPIRA